MLTELEGAILSELEHRGSQTAFQVRRSFAESPSLEWRGSAGAVYPAVKRLERDGYIEGVATGDGRATRHLSVTPSGRAAMLEWASDTARATSSGIDPFRIRAGIWAQMPEKRRREVLVAMRREIESSIEYLSGFARNRDTIERVSVELSVYLQRTRLAWLDDALAGDERRSDKRSSRR